MKKLIYVLPFILFLTIFPLSAHSQTQTIYGNYQYVLGDNDSKVEGRRICFMEAKRLCLEKAGIYLESYTEAENLQITRDQIASYTAGLIKTELIEEKLRFDGENITIDMTVKAEVDLDDIADMVRKLRDRRDIDFTPPHTKTIFKKTFTDSDIGADGNIKAFAWNGRIKKGDLIEVVGRMPGQIGQDAKEIHIYRGADKQPKWKTTQNGYFSGVVQNIPLGKSYYIWLEKGKNIAVTVRITREAPDTS